MTELEAIKERHSVRNYKIDKIGSGHKVTI